MTFDTAEARRLVTDSSADLRTRSEKVAAALLAACDKIDLLIAEGATVAMGALSELRRLNTEINRLRLRIEELEQDQVAGR